MSLEDIEKELYGQKTHERQEQTEVNEPETAREKTRARNPWRAMDAMPKTDPEPVRKLESIGSKVFIALAVVLVILLGFAGFYLYQYFSTKDARFELMLPADARVGEPFTFAAVFENVSKKELYEPIFSVKLPDGVIFVQQPDKRVIQESVPNSAPGDMTKREYQVMITGDPYQTYSFEGHVSYRYESSSLSSRFEKDASGSIVAKNPVLTLDMTSPESVINGQDFEIHVRYKNETDAILSNVRIEMQLPQGFSLNNSDPKLDGNKLQIPQLAGGEEGTLILSGFMVDSSNGSAQIGAQAFMSVSNNDYQVSSKQNEISVAPSPLDVEITSDQQDNVTAPGKQIQMNMRITNNADVPLAGVTASAKFIGSLFDLATVSGNGSLRDADRTYTWTAAQADALRTIEPGQSVILPFSIKTKSGYISQKDTALQVLGIATSPTVPAGITAQQTIGSDQYTLKLGGSLGLEQDVFFKEPGADVQNSGPMPPQVGKTTTFTVHWKLHAQGTDMKGVRVTASLGKGMQWTGKLSVRNTQSAPKFNAQTQEIEWNLDAVQAKGVSQDPEAVFQLSFTPASNTAGSQYIFLEHIAFGGKDVFTGKDQSGSFSALDSRDIADANALPLGYDKIKQ